MLLNLIVFLNLNINMLKFNLEIDIFNISKYLIVSKIHDKKIINFIFNFDN
jgi:hypothetical protein